MNRLSRHATGLTYVGFFLLGWIAVLVPTLIISVERHFAESDSGIGLLYLISAACYVAGSLGGGPFVERVGRRVAFPTACLLLGGGLLTQGFAPAWTTFILGAALQGLGAGVLEICGNSLVIDTFPDTRSNALSRLHVFYALGALTAPSALAWLVRAAVGWQSLMLAAGFAGCLLAALLLPQEMTSGRRTANAITREPAVGGEPPHRRRVPVALAILALASALYVASEAGVSGWVVRYLSPATGGLAPFALTLFWAGLAAGRIVSARISHRFDLVHVVLVCAALGAIGLVAAVAVAADQASMAMFAIVGLAYGPIYPSTMALASARYPERSASVSGLIGTAAFAGQSVYPPIMGFLSPTLGLGIGMLGAAALVVASGLAVFTARDVSGVGAFVRV